MKILRIFSLIFSADLKLLSQKRSICHFKIKVLFENSKIKKNKKYNPPIHCADERQRIKVGSKYLILLNIEKPVPVTPEIASKKAL